MQSETKRILVISKGFKFVGFFGLAENFVRYFSILSSYQKVLADEHDFDTGKNGFPPLNS